MGLNNFKTIRKVHSIIFICGGLKWITDSFMFILLSTFGLFYLGFILPWVPWVPWVYFIWQK